MTGKVINMKRTKKLVSSIALAMVFCFTFALPTLAAPGDQAPAISTAAITKELHVPIGTVLPTDLSYEFHIKQMWEDEKTPTANMPKIGQDLVPPVPGTGKITVDFFGNPSGVNHDNPVGDTEVYWKESAELFGNITWPHAGVFEYEIRELAGTNNTNHPNPPPSPPDPVPPYEVSTYSGAAYSVKVYVGVDDDTGDLVITHIGALRIIDDKGNQVPDEEQEKLIVTPGGGTGADYSYDRSQMIFVNTYVKTNGGPDVEDPDDWTLAINKEVAGDMSDPTVYFAFNMKITKPSLVSGAPTYLAYVVEENPTTNNFEIVTSSDNFSGTIGSGGSIPFKTGETVNFKLKHGQWLAFTDTPVGTNYVVSEVGSAGYAPSATINGGFKEQGEKGAGLLIPDIDPQTENIHYIVPLYVENGDSMVLFLNDRGEISQTGINTDNLPFIALFAVMTMALAGFIVYRVRREKKYNV